MGADTLLSDDVMGSEWGDVGSGCSVQTVHYSLRFCFLGGFVQHW